MNRLRVLMLMAVVLAQPIVTASDSGGASSEERDAAFERFIPSEEVSADIAIAFPVDI